MGKRAVTKAATRQRILDAAEELIVESGVHDTSLQAVARRARSTRATVYHQFGSREELLLAVMNEALDRADVREVRKALQHRDAAQAMRGMIRAACRFWAGEYALFAQMRGLAAIDPGMAVVVEAKEGVRRGHMTNLAYRLEEQGCLRAGCSQRKALDTLLFVTSFEAFDELYGRAKMAPEAVASMLVDAAQRTLIA
jgi:AcrR family transcriptional regulator